MGWDRDRSGFLPPPSPTPPDLDSHDKVFQTLLKKLIHLLVASWENDESRYNFFIGKKKINCQVTAVDVDYHDKWHIST